jgi:hypothetical protein
MDDLSAPAGSDAERRTGLTYSSIGVEVEEPLFLDEAEGDGASAGQPDPPSPFELFADEEALRPGPATLLAAPSPVAGRAATAWPGSPGAPRPARAIPNLEAGELFAQSSSPRQRVSLVALFVLVAAGAMFVTVQACQVNRGPGTGSAAQRER